ncbi:hypothetical protein EYF80_055074 [Liparis tanakae]|uniref:Uncharacterized protein n=1 Tax=Liparis tanakae TaxID=230148 RepID=A0A4Z2F253_9TELE|nr:hypothetical protein EYF80_055074 [Liparis tanakae]
MTKTSLPPRCLYPGSLKGPNRPSELLLSDRLRLMKFNSMRCSDGSTEQREQGKEQGKEAGKEKPCSWVFYLLVFAPSSPRLPEGC